MSVRRTNLPTAGPGKAREPDLQFQRAGGAGHGCRQRHGLGDGPHVRCVKVIAAISRGGTPDANRHSTRPASSDVLPVPAAASTSSVEASSVSARRRSASSGSFAGRVQGHRVGSTRILAMPATDPAAIRARMRGIVKRLEALLDRADGPGLLFDADRNHAEDRVIKVAAPDLACPLWIVGDLHGDLLALEAALALIDECRLRDRRTSAQSYSFCHPPPKICYSQPRCAYCAAISRNNDLGFPFISPRVLLWAGLVIGLAMILIIIAMGVGDR